MLANLIFLWNTVELYNQVNNNQCKILLDGAFLHQLLIFGLSLQKVYRQAALRLDFLRGFWSAFILSAPKSSLFFTEMKTWESMRVSQNKQTI